MKKILLSIVMLVFTTAAFSQSCLQRGQTFFTETSPGIFSLTIDYTTLGNKSLETTVFCGSTQIFTDCFSATGPGTKVYPGLACSGGTAALYVRFITKTGSCSGTDCDTTFIGNPAAPQPVKLSSFSAVRSKQVVSLNWNTELEIDAKEFIVERAEGTEFRSVGTITANGNSTVKQSYSFTDKNDNEGVTYYRLKNVDLDSKFTYSAIKTVKGIGSGSDVTVFPNPARANSKISVVGASANSSIQLVDFSGKILRNINSNTINSFDLNGVQNGTYLIRITNKTTNEVVNKKLTVSN